MTTLRRLLTAFSIAIGLWVAASVVGMFFDPLRIRFWSASLMWALLASLMVAPALVVMTDDTIAEEEADDAVVAASQDEANATGGPSSAPPVDEQPSFVDNARAAYPVEVPESDPAAAEESMPLWEYAERA